MLSAAFNEAMLSAVRTARDEPSRFFDVFNHQARISERKTKA